MPVTAKLSRAFYEKLGDDVANELVEWFNQVDLTYKTELRELNDLNFTRFDARVGERLAQLRSELRAELQADMDARFAKVDERFAKVEDRFDRLEARFEKLQVEIREARISGIRWTVAFWTPTILALVAVLLRQ